jgi:putative transposase
MLKAFKFRLYPTKAQATKINQNIGCARLVYNLMLDAKTKHYEATKKTLHITPASFKADKTFLKDVDSLALANAQLNLEQAYRNFFKNPEHFGFPQFKSKKYSRLSYKTNNQINKDNPKKNSIRFDGNRLKLPKVGYVKIVEHRQHEGEIKSVVVSHERSGEYYASVLCELKNIEPLLKTDKHIGIDLGLHDFIVCSDGQRIQTPKFLRKAEQKLAKRQRAFSKTVKDSKNHEKLRLKVSRCHQKIKNQRNDFLQKLSTKLIRENQVISVEDLSVKGMEANHCIAKSVADASFSMFVNMLEYKAEWYGRTIVKIDRFYPSTQLCSGCGFQNKKLRGMKGLKVREWTCPCCGEVHDRDLNASRNIDREGLKILNRRNDGVSSLTECQTDELVLSSDILAREATQSSDAW